jgi:26S proteasome regulatory subunit N13
LPFTSIGSSKFPDTFRCGLSLKTLPKRLMRLHLPNHLLRPRRFSPCPLFEVTLSCVVFSTNQPTSEQLSQLRSLVAQMSGGATVEPGESSYIANLFCTDRNGTPEPFLTDVLTADNLDPLFASHPELIQSIFPHLPPDLPANTSSEVLSRIVSSPQFRSAVASFDRALRTGLLGGLVRQLGLPEEAGTGVEAFLRAVREQARGDRPGGENMDTD